MARPTRQVQYLRCCEMLLVIFQILGDDLAAETPLELAFKQFAREARARMAEITRTSFEQMGWSLDPGEGAK